MTSRAQGKQRGRPRKTQPRAAVPGGSVREAARRWGVSKSTAARWISAGRVPTLDRRTYSQLSRGTDGCLAGAADSAVGQGGQVPRPVVGCATTGVKPAVVQPCQ